MPLISVIMPCFNHERYVAESIKSVLDQTEKDLELIVVDDGSTDDSKWIIAAAMAEDDRVKGIFHEQNKGASEARNSGLTIARSEYVAFCDADDLWLPEKLARQIETLKGNPEAAVAYSDALIVNSGGEKTGAKFSDRFSVPGNGSGNLFPVLCVRNFINMQSALVRRDCIRLENYFDPSIRWVEDWLFWVKLARAYPFIYLPEPLGFYRVHEASSATLQSEGIMRNRVKVFLEILRFPDLPRKILSSIFYHMGVTLSDLKTEAATSVFAYKRALMYNPFNWKAIVRLILCSPLVLSCPALTTFATWVKR